MYVAAVECPSSLPLCCSGACLANDVNNCGSCGHSCAVANAMSPTCVAGQCGLICNPGFGDCDGNQANGCEAQLGSDTKNCGDCGHSCAAANATASCTASKCAFTCNPGFGDCDGNPANGCEAGLSSDVNQCGGCGTKCSTVNGTPMCGNGSCIWPSCANGFKHCAVGNTGCETAIISDVKNCGACGRQCAIVPNGVPTCSGSACIIGGCTQGYADCDLIYMNGCEINTANDPYAIWGDGKQPILTIRSLQQSNRWERGWALIAASFRHRVAASTTHGILRCITPLKEAA